MKEEMHVIYLIDVSIIVIAVILLEGICFLFPIQR